MKVTCITYKNDVIRFNIYSVLTNTLLLGLVCIKTKNHLIIFHQGCQCSIECLEPSDSAEQTVCYTNIKVVVQPAASEDLSKVVFSLSNPNVSSHVTGQKCTLKFLANY